MKRYWNNKGRIIFSVVLIVFCSMLIALCFILPDNASSGPYTISAHGQSYGVNRSSLSTFVYVTGNCVHCHEQHASIGGSEPTPNSPAGPDQFLLFSDNHISQTDNFCYKCHVDVSSYQTGGLINRSYSYRAGGYTDTLDDIKEAFSFCYSGCSTPSSSSHNLGDIRTFITSKSWGYTTDSNPCAACHNPHSAQRDPHTTATRGWPVSKPSDHSKDNNAWGLWGDNLPTATERMSNYTAAGYQAPYRSGGVTYEPDGSATQDGSNLTDYVTFCTDCHNSTNSISTSHSLPNPSPPSFGRSTLYTINWANEMHGGFPATYCSYNVPPLTSLLAAPYNGLTRCGQYVTACTDCHEPHGSPNNFLVRKQVNGGTVTVTQYGAGDGPEGGGRLGKEWAFLCEKCHTGLRSGDGLTPHHNAGSGLGCETCHPGGDYRNCTDCHFHGNSSIDGTPYGKPLF